MPESGGRIVVAGASGLIGRALVTALRADGIAVTTLVRRPASGPDEIEWLDDTNPLDPAVLEGARAVVGLNGATIGRFPWTAKYKNTLVWSRIAPTRALSRAVRELGTAAPAFVLGIRSGLLRHRPGRPPHGGRPARRHVPGRSLRRVGDLRPRRGAARARGGPAHGPRRPCGGRAEAPHAAHPRGGLRADRRRSAGVALDLARRRGTRHPPRPRHGPGRTGA